VNRNYSKEMKEALIFGEQPLRKHHLIKTHLTNLEAVLGKPPDFIQKVLLLFSGEVFKQ
jgi:hypothetical protein